GPAAAVGQEDGAAIEAECLAQLARDRLQDVDEVERGGDFLEDLDDGEQMRPLALEPGHACRAAVTVRRRGRAGRRHGIASGRGVALIPAAHERDVERDYVQDNDFRQTNTFFYLTELETQDAWLLIVAGGEAATTVLFLPPRTPSQERWTGLRLGPDSTAARLSGIGRVLPTDSLDRMLAAALFRASGPIYAPLDVTTRDEPRLKELVFSGRDVRNLRPLVDSMRLVKDGDEIARMRKAIDISAAGHVAAMQAARPGVWEYELEAALEA